MNSILITLICVLIVDAISISETNETVAPRVARCQYGQYSYDCGSKGPSNQYCNYLGCNMGSSSCCQLMWCSNYIGCVCGTTNTVYDCKN